MEKMTVDKHEFEELLAPSQVAKELGVSPATLRNYSTIVEKITANGDYYERNKRNSRLYRKQDLADLQALHKLSQDHGLTLQQAARQIFAVSEVKEDTADKQALSTEMMNDKQVIKLLEALSQTIANQNQAIKDLQEQLAKIQEQNQTLLESQKLAKPKSEVDPEIEALPDISGIVIQGQTKEEKSPEDKRKEVAADMMKSEDQVRDEILNKAKENAKKRATANVHRTLEDMQLPKKKKHWWQRFLN